MHKNEKRLNKYVRDGRAPIPMNPATSRVMSANKSKNTKPELNLRKELWNNKLKGYRLHPKNIPGRPDIVYSKIKLAVFVNGCFWHRCPHCKPSIPKTNKDFWDNKFDSNIKRDLRKQDELERQGWKVLTIWECEIKKDLSKTIEQIKKILNEQ